MATDRLAAGDLFSKWGASPADTMLRVIIFVVLCMKFQICKSNLPMLAVVTLSLQLHGVIFSQTAQRWVCLDSFLWHTT